MKKKICQRDTFYETHTHTKYFGLIIDRTCNVIKMSLQWSMAEALNAYHYLIKMAKLSLFLASCMPNMKRSIIFEQQNNYNNNIEMKKKIAKQSERLISTCCRAQRGLLKMLKNFFETSQNYFYTSTLFFTFLEQCTLKLFHDMISIKV